MRKLYRSKNDVIFCGICGGIAEYFDVDSTFVRIGVVILTLITGFIPVTLGYFIAYLIIPKKSSGKSLMAEIKEEIKEEVKESE